MHRSFAPDGALRASSERADGTDSNSYRDTTFFFSPCQPMKRGTISISYERHLLAGARQERSADGRRSVISTSAKIIFFWRRPMPRSGRVAGAVARPRPTVRPPFPRAADDARAQYRGLVDNNSDFKDCKIIGMNGIFSEEKGRQWNCAVKRVPKWSLGAQGKLKPGYSSDNSANSEIPSNQEFYTSMKPSIYLQKSSKLSFNWRAQYNPLRGLTLRKSCHMLEAGERGNYARLQWLYRFVEKRNSTLRAVVQRRQGVDDPARLGRPLARARSGERSTHLGGAAGSAVARGIRADR